MNETKELELKYLTDKSFNIIILLSLLTKNGFSIVICKMLQIQIYALIHQIKIY